jgi:hypothetical protein
MTILVAAVAFFFLPDEPRSAKFLSQEEREVLVTTLGRDLYGQEAVTGGKEEMAKEEHFKWKEVKETLLPQKSNLFKYRLTSHPYHRSNPPFSTSTPSSCPSTSSSSSSPSTPSPSSSPPSSKASSPRAPP